MPYAPLATGIDAYYEVSGQGEPVLFIQGTGAPCDVWRQYQVPAFARECQVIICDLRQMGRTGGRDEFITIETLAADMVALLDHLKVPAAHVIGHSMGGRIGLSMALDYPGRVKTLVLAAAGSGPAVRVGDDCVPAIPQFLLEGLVTYGFEGYVKEEALNTHTYLTDEFRQAHPEKVQEFWDSLWPNHAKLRPYLRHITARHMWEASHRLGNVRVPTLVLIGTHDTHGSNHVPQSRAMAERIPGAQLVEWSDMSHGYFWQAPERTNGQLLAWIREHA